jgi:hypothetical protein
MRASVNRSGGGNDVRDPSGRSWRELVSDWKVWLSLGICLLIATLAWLFGYDRCAGPRAPVRFHEAHGMSRDPHKMTLGQRFLAWENRPEAQGSRRSRGRA